MIDTIVSGLVHGNVYALVAVGIPVDPFTYDGTT